MRLPTPLSRKNKNVHKHSFGHVLIIAGSPRMLGAGCLSALAAMRSGAGLVTFAIPKSLNLTAQKKVSNTIMTFPLPETKQQTLSLAALKDILDFSPSCDAIALGPGMTTQPSTKNLIFKLMEQLKTPLVMDADSLHCLASNPEILLKTSTPKIITPHPKEMARLIHKTTQHVQNNRKHVAEHFAHTYKCTVLLKGHETIVATNGKKTYTNKTGNAGMATAGSGDVLTGMIAAFLAQGLDPHPAAKWSAFFHGKAGDMAAKKTSKISLIATDIIDHIPQAFQSHK